MDFEYISHKNKIRDSIIELQRKKDLDYGRSFDNTFRLFGRDVILIRLHDKFNRFEQLTNSGFKNIQNESVIDTIIDISCYAVLGIMSLTNEFDFSKLFQESIKGTYDGEGMVEAKSAYDLLLKNKNTYSKNFFVEGLREICFNTFHYISKYTYENKGKV